MEPPPDLEELLRRASTGDGASVDRLLQVHRSRLKQMIRVRLNRQIVARVDPSDVVQETLAEAVRRLPQYLNERPIAFYPWLRQLAWKRLEKLHEFHLKSQRRAVGREMPPLGGISDDSAMELANRFVAVGSSPSERILREELKLRVHAALARLSESEREVLVLRYLEQLTPAEAREVLGISQEAFAKRHVRAIHKLRKELVEPSE
jgi:RNA polymerase sigma-70 factor (ECF subfamily)